MKPIDTIRQEIRHHQSQARENFAQSQIKDQLMMQQGLCELDKSAALKDYESRAWPVRQYRNWFADGVARRQEGAEHGAAQQALRNLQQADVLTLTAAKSVIKGDVQNAQSSYFQSVARITESEIKRIAREQFFIDKVEREARLGFVAAYDALVDDLADLPHDIDAALSTLTERLQALALLNDDNRREFSTQLGAVLAAQSAEVNFQLQSLHMAYGGAQACLHQLDEASAAALQTMQSDLGRLRDAFESGSWHPSIPARAHEAWNKPVLGRSAREDEMFLLMTPASRQKLMAPAAFVLTHVQFEIDALVSAEAMRQTALAMYQEKASCHDVEMHLTQSVDALGALVEHPATHHLDSWFAEAYQAHLPPHRQRAHKALVEAIVVMRTHGIGQDVDTLGLPDMLDSVAPQVLFDVRELSQAITTLRRAPLAGLPDIADALDAMQAKLLIRAARAVTSPIQMRLHDVIPHVVAADYRRVEQALFGAHPKVRAQLGAFLETEWDVRAYYMRTIQQPQTLEQIIINGESFLEEYHTRVPDLHALAKDRYAQALDKHMQAHPEDVGERDALIACYGFGLGGSRGLI